MKIIIDNTCNNINEFDSNNVGQVLIDLHDNRYAFDEILKTILTPKQYNNFIASTKNRVFSLSKQRESYLIDYSINGFPIISPWYKTKTK